MAENDRTKTNGKASKDHEKEMTAAQRLMAQQADERLSEMATFGIPDDDGFRTKYPNLFEFLTTDYIPRNGKKYRKRRCRGSFALEGTFVVMTLTDGDAKKTCSVNGNTFEDALAELNQKVITEKGWRPMFDRSEGYRVVKSSEKE